MKNLFYVAAGLLVIIWAITFFSFKTYSAVHILLVVAFFSALVGVFNRKRRLARILSDQLLHA